MGNSFSEILERLSSYGKLGPDSMAGDDYFDENEIRGETAAGISKDYLKLPDSIIREVSHTEYMWLSDAEKHNLVTDMTTPPEEMYGD